MCTSTEPTSAYATKDATLKSQTPRLLRSTIYHHRLPPNFSFDFHPPVSIGFSCDDSVDTRSSSSLERDLDRSFSSASQPGVGFTLGTCPRSTSTSLVCILAAGLLYMVVLRFDAIVVGAARGVRGGFLRPVIRREARFMVSRIVHCRFLATYHSHHMPPVVED